MVTRCLLLRAKERERENSSNLGSDSTSAYLSRRAHKADKKGDGDASMAVGGSYPLGSDGGGGDDGVAAGGDGGGD